VPESTETAGEDAEPNRTEGVSQSWPAGSLRLEGLAIGPRRRQQRQHVRRSDRARHRLVTSRVLWLTRNITYGVHMNTNPSNPQHTSIDPFSRVEKAKNLAPGEYLAQFDSPIIAVTPTMNEFDYPVRVTVQLDNGRTFELGGDERVTVDIKHGTSAAISRHRRYRVEMCDACRDLDRRLIRERVTKHRSARHNELVTPDELFEIKNEPTRGLAVLVPEGDPNGRRYFIVRMPDRTPRLLAIGPSGAITMDGRAYPAAREIPIEDGQKIAFNRTGDVWRVRLAKSGEPTFERC